MAKRRRKNRGLRRRPRTWLSVISLIVALVGAYVAGREHEPAVGVEDKTRIFAAFAELDTDLEEVMRMRNSPTPPFEKSQAMAWRTIVQVVDGDSVKLDGGETVRLLGIDAPEASVNRKLRDDLRNMNISVREESMVALGKEAGRYARRLAEGKRCWPEYDRQRTDQYGRSMAYVHLQDGIVLNEAMVSGGYAKVYMNQSFVYKKRYIILQGEARYNGRGFWAAGDGSSDR